MRILVSAALVGACVVAVTGCGSAGPLPRHGILFAHSDSARLPVFGDGGDIYLERPIRAHPRRLLSSPDPTDEPAWSPSGKQIAFTRSACKEGSECFGASEIFVANSDGSGRRELTFPSTGELRSAHPSWSPDGRRIAFAREMDVYSQLAIADVASGKYQLLGLSGTEPTWGKPGIAYLAKKVSRVKNLGKPRNSIRIVDPKTHRRRPFASPPVGYTVMSVAWSVRGELASFATHHGYAHPAKATIYSSVGRQLSEFVVPKKWRVCGLTWSPRGDRLLFTVVPAGKGVNPGVYPQLYTVDRNGKRWHHIRLGLGLTSCSVSWR